MTLTMSFAMIENTIGSPSVAYTALSFMGAAGIVSFLRFFFFLGGATTKLNTLTESVGALTETTSGLSEDLRDHAITSNDRFVRLEMLHEMHYGGSQPTEIGHYDRRSRPARRSEQFGVPLGGDE